MGSGEALRIDARRFDDLATSLHAGPQTTFDDLADDLTAILDLDKTYRFPWGDDEEPPSFEFTLRGRRRVRSVGYPDLEGRPVDPDLEFPVQFISARERLVEHLGVGEGLDLVVHFGATTTVTVVEAVPRQIRSGG